MRKTLSGKRVDTKSDDNHDYSPEVDKKLEKDYFQVEISSNRHSGSMYLPSKTNQMLLPSNFLSVAIL